MIQSTGTWNPTGDLNVARSSHAATLLLPNGKVVVTGGFGGGGLTILGARSCTIRQRDIGP